MTLDALAARAREVLDGNWIGRSTKPAPQLYPFQWSWDSAFIAIGNRHDRWDRAVLELETLFDAQWADGRVPHIVFDHDDDDYFPSAGFWDSASAPAAPRHVATSGIVQPAVHATAARLVYEARPDAEGRAFLERVYPRLEAWHGYLRGSRSVGSPLLEIWHPWESGMDNSPLWDGPLARIEPSPDEVPPYRRVDATHADAADRPTDRDYDRYAYLVARLRAEGYTPADPTALPFRVRDVLFAAAFVAAERDLDAIAAILGVSRASSAGTVERAIDERTWSDDVGMHLDVDARTDETITVRSCSGLMGLLCDGLAATRRARLVETLRSVAVTIGDGIAVPSVPVDDPTFEPTRYWRGPIWIQINWLLAHGLRDDAPEVAAALRRGIVELVARSGFWEYFDPMTLRGHGTDRFSWTAALLLDVLADSGRRQASISTVEKKAFPAS